MDFMCRSLQPCMTQQLSNFIISFFLSKIESAVKIMILIAFYVEAYPAETLKVILNDLKLLSVLIRTPMPARLLQRCCILGKVIPNILPVMQNKCLGNSSSAAVSVVQVF